MILSRPLKTLLHGTLLLCSCLLVAACGKTEDTAFSGERAMTEVEELVRIVPRHSGSGGARRTAVHLESRLKALGLTASVDTFSDETPFGPVFFHNVLGRLPGKTDRLIILGSHFDTKSGIADDFQGANDSGSSSGALLEIARVLEERAPLETEFLIAFFDGEECQGEYGPTDGLHGSRRLAQQLVAAGGSPHVEAVIVLDMIGDRDLNITVPRNSTSTLVKELFFAAHEVGTRAKFGLAKGAILDDHVPFLNAGMPAVLAIDFEYGSAAGRNDYWHTMEDSLDKLSVDSLQIVGDTILQMIDNLQ